MEKDPSQKQLEDKMIQLYIIFHGVTTEESVYMFKKAIRENYLPVVDPWRRLAKAVIAAGEFEDEGAGQ